MSLNVGKRPVNNSEFLTTTPDHLRALVLDYLCHNCHTRTARAFIRDSAVRHLDADGDEIMPPGKESGSETSAVQMDEMLKLVELRQQIKIHISSGRVDDATNLLKDYFPLVLSEAKPHAYRYLAPQKSTPEWVEAVTPSSVDPTHLSLNLRILAFTEAARTVPLEYDPYFERDTETASSAFHVTSVPSPKSPIYEQDDEAKQTELLCMAQKLYSAASELQDPKARAAYLKELGLVGGLLAYKHPESSPMAKYLRQERRDAVSDQINRAILYRTGRRAVSNLELYTRYTSAVWAFMHEFRMKPPPLAKRPIGVLLPPTNRSRASNLLPSKGNVEKQGIESLPPFNLRQFLDAKT